MNRTNIKSIKFSYKKKAALYCFFLVGLFALYGTYIPCLMDYYIARPEESYGFFFQENFIKLPYTFEGIVIGMALAVFYCLTLRAGVSTLIMSALLLILTHASYIKFINRKELFRLDDLRLTEAAGMVADYFRFSVNRWLVMLVGMSLLFVGAGVALDCLGRKTRTERNFRAETPKRGLLLIRCARLVCILLLCATLGFYMDFFLREGSVIDEIEPMVSQNDIYVLYRFLQNDRLSAISADRVAEKYEFLLAQEPVKEAADWKVYPNVIAIMNESWWSTDYIDSNRIAFSKDPMDPYKELAGRCGTGYVTSNVFGGGTVSSEMEFLTGLNTKFFRADSAYAQIMGRKIPSLADYFNGLDYETVAIHPYYGSFYNRDAAYETMGFDRVIFEEDMQYKDIYTRYISDESLAKEIIAQLQQGSGAPKFIWAVSIANHRRSLDYYVESVTDYAYPIAVTVEGEKLSEEDYDILVNYVNGIYLANEAFAQLVEYFSGVDQPTVLLMFGDHCPNLSVETLEALGLGEEDGEGETAERLYSMPVIMWSNVSAERLYFSGESIYYLPQMLIDYAGLPDSDMTRILRYARTCFRTNSLKFVRDAAGEELHRCSEEQLQALSHYKAVQYDILFGEGTCRDVWQPITDGQ